MAAANLLSDLPDDLLRRVLYFAPAKEGASTAVLSRRWRSLWRTSGAVNLDTRSLDRTHGPSLQDPAKREAFLRRAMAALAAAAEHGPVRRLGLHMEAYNGYAIDWFVSYRRDESEPEHNLIGEVLSNPAARGAEELRVAGVAPDWTCNYYGGPYYRLSIDTLPHQALRVVHIVNAELEVDYWPDDVSFPRLNSLLLHGCHVTMCNLQAMIHGAPQLTAVQLESLNFPFESSDDEDDSSSTNSARQISTNNLTGVAIANLLHCCPVVRDLRRLRIKEAPRGSVHSSSDIERKARSDFDKPVKKFFKHRRGRRVRHDDEYDEVPDIHGLSKRTFN